MSVSNQFGNRLQRDVPFTLKVRALMPSSVALFGAIFFAFGLLMSSFFVSHSEVGHFWKFIGPLSTTQGVVTGMEKTNSSEGGGKHSHGTDIYAVHYTFTPEGSRQAVSGVSYQLGSNPLGQVMVEYKKENPSISRIHGLRTSEFGWAVAFVLIFPLVGLVLAFSGIFRGLAAIKVMKIGVPAVGTLSSCEATGTKINNRRVMRLIFTFTTPDNQQATASLTRLNLKPAWRNYLYGNMPGFGDIIGMFTGKQPQPQQPAQPQNAPQEMVLYNPANPYEAYLPAELGDDVRVTPNGNIYDGNPLMFIGAIVPLILIAGAIVGAIAIVMR